MENKQHPPLIGIIFSLVVFAVITVIIATGIIVIGDTVGGVVANVTNVANTMIEETQYTKRTAIEWEAQVEMAKITASTTKETNIVYVIFWIVRFAALCVVVYCLYQFVKGYYHEQTA